MSSSSKTPLSLLEDKEKKKKRWETTKDRYFYRTEMYTGFIWYNIPENF